MINYQKAAGEAINRVKQDLATKEIEQRLKHEIELQKMNETLITTRPETETGENLENRSNSNNRKILRTRNGQELVLECRGKRFITGAREVETTQESCRQSWDSD